jgi:hypothetical protein
LYILINNKRYLAGQVSGLKPYEKADPVKQKLYFTNSLALAISKFYH